MHAKSRPASLVPLPPPRMSGRLSVEEAMAGRRSVRSFSDQPLTLQELSQLLWALQGITHPQGYRTCPSAGALYPLEIYVATAQGLFQYRPRSHDLWQVGTSDLRRAMARLALNQTAVQEAGAVFVLTAVQERMSRTYGALDSPRYIHLEIGHAAQNLLLQAVALGLGAVPIAAFHEQQMQKVLDLPEDHDPLYLVPVGRLR